MTNQPKTVRTEPSETNPALFLFALLLPILIASGIILARAESQHYQLKERESVQEILGSMRAALESRLYSNIHKSEGVKALVALNPELTQDDFARAMAVQFDGQNDLRNIGLARHMTIRFMYPMENNEAAIGMNFRENPLQYAEAALARNTRKIILAGPLNLVQGGEGIVARIPIYLSDTLNYPDGFWGLASVVLDTDVLFASAGVQSDYNGVKIAIRGRHARGPEGDVFFGDPAIFNGHPVLQSIELPYGSWQMAALPSAGWSGYQLRLTPLTLGHFVASLIILVFSGFNVFFFRKLQSLKRLLSEAAATDALTGIANRRSFTDHLQWAIKRGQRKPEPLSLAIIDIDHFKAINDTYGHHAGDNALIAIAGAIKEACRNNDYPARWGGEEFVVLLHNTAPGHALIVAERIREHIKELQVTPRQITASIGLATLPADAPHTPEDVVMEHLLVAADNALYLAKDLGRDRSLHSGAQATPG